MKIECPHCAIELDVAEKRAGKQITCPACQTAFAAPPLLARRKTDEEAFYAEQARHEETAVAAAAAAPAKQRRSGWSAALRILGIIIGAIWLLVPGLGWIIGATFVFQVFLAAFALDVLTDIRWLLQEQHRNSRTME